MKGRVTIYGVERATESGIGVETDCTEVSMVDKVAMLHAILYAFADNEAERHLLVDIARDDDMCQFLFGDVCAVEASKVKEAGLSTQELLDKFLEEVRKK